jgi:hypothetical protein
VLLCPQARRRGGQGEKGRGQASLEYLLVFAVFLGVITLLVSGAFFVLDDAKLALDLQQARSFADELAAWNQQNAATGVLARKPFGISPLTRWHLSISPSGELSIELENRSGSRRLLVALGSSSRPFETRIDGRTFFSASQEGGSLVFEQLDS